ncbi:MAG: DUF2309 domain-containing protein [Thiobacillus sp.]|nr:DUF2309 domain-containing protein [Thiobacillus sp.]
MSTHSASPADNPIAWLHDLVHHLEHVLPAQAPIKDFVHHNTLHGFQHLPFREALAAAEAATGAHGFQPVETFRAYFQQGRVDLSDLNAALDETPELQADALLPGNIPRRDVLRTGLQFDLSPLTASTLEWRLEDMGALEHVQAGVSEEAQARLRAASPDTALSDLWAACQATLAIAAVDASESIERLPEEDEATQQWSERQLKHEAADRMATLLERVGHDLSLRGLLLALTGRDLMDELRPYLVRHLAAHLDQGMAAWHNPVRAQGLYAAWLASARTDPHFELNDLPGWQAMSERLPDDPTACILQKLQLLGLPEARWVDYLGLLAKELPGWSGMVLWRHEHPGYAGETTPIDMLDYLAIRLVLERVYAQRLTATHFNCEASLPGLRGHLRRHPAELQVRLALYAGQLPEWLEDQGHRLVRSAVHSTHEEDDCDWLPVARLIDTWLAQPQNRDALKRGAHAWPLFVLCQHLGLSPHTLTALGHNGATALLNCLQELTPQAAGWLWLQAYERHYREQIFSALLANQDRGPWKTRANRPTAQLVFCMDDREEGLRRHLEELAPNLETLGAAAHFNVPHAWRALDECGAVPLAPVVPTVVIPAHEVHEVPQERDRIVYIRHTERRHTRLTWKTRLMQGTRIGLIGPMLGTVAAAPLTLGVLAGKAFAPGMLGRLSEKLRRAYERPVATRIDFVAPNDSPAATPEARRLGFTDIEQADRVESLLRNTGLTYGFAPLAVIAGHGSHSQNNPHGSAYNCGACAGHFSGPNARLVAAMANRAEVRAILAERSIVIPDDTWFIGAIHDTCDDVVTWFDGDQVPAALLAVFAQLRQDVDRASQLHAQERSRRFMSASLSMSPESAWKHVTGRANDFSQARPELGHATNASAFIGRRSATRGAFFDRRMFLISYDPTQDPDGSIIERHLLTNGLVGAGISLEYYFSTANNERYGCGTKVMHNVAGLLGVMDGASSDLRTGLPRQMIEVHEAMRVLAIVEQKIDLLTTIYNRQPPLQELVGNGWIQLAAKDPDNGDIHRFVPGTGWVKWQPTRLDIPTVACSFDWYRGQRDALPPTLIERGAKTA